MKKKILLLSCASLLATPIVNAGSGEAIIRQTDNTSQDNTGDNTDNNFNDQVQQEPEKENDSNNSNNNDNNNDNENDSSNNNSNNDTTKPNKPDSSNGNNSGSNPGPTKPNQPILDTSKEEAKLEELKGNLSTIEENKNKIEAEISSLQQFISATEKELSEIRDKIAATESQINITEEIIKTTEGKLAKLEKKIELKTEELEKQKILLGHTLSFLYEYRDFGFLQFFFQTENLSELLTMVGFINLIMDENQDIYERIVSQEKDLQKEKSKLNKTMKQLNEDKAKLELLKEQQLQEKATQDELLAAQLEQELEAFERLGAEEKAETALNAEIRKILLSLSNSIGNISPTGKMVSPMKAGTYTITSTFGYRTHPVHGTQKFHNGIDMAGSCGTPIYSAADGVATIVGPASGYGNWVVIFHEKLGLFSIYGHMYSDGIFIKQGQTIKQGQLIGEVGNAGTSTGCHLHYAVANSYNGSTFSYIDPLSVIE